MNRHPKWYEVWNPYTGLLGGFIAAALVNGVVIGVCIFLAGCGGGGSEDPQDDRPAMCKPDPRVCV